MTSQISTEPTAPAEAAKASRTKRLSKALKAVTRDEWKTFVVAAIVIPTILGLTTRSWPLAAQVFAVGTSVAIAILIHHLQTITKHQREVEANLLRVEQQLESDQRFAELGRLAASIVHEINTPLQFIYDNVNFFESSFKGIQGALDDYRQLAGVTSSRDAALNNAPLGEIDQRFGVDLIESELPATIQETYEGMQWVAKITAAIRAFSHPETGEVRTVDVNDLLRDTLMIAAGETRDIATVETNYGTLPAIQCSAGDIRHVLLNLIVNATHAVEDRNNQAQRRKGTIRVTTTHDSEYVTIEIADDGTGIPAEIQAQVFEPFFTTKEVGKGTGQGLALVRRVIVEQHKGMVELDSSVGEGATFRLRIPRAPR